MLSNTTYTKDNVHLFHCLSKALMKCRKTLEFSWLSPLYHLFQIHYKPPKMRIFFSESFPLTRKETSHVLLSSTAVYLGNEGHLWAQGVPSSSPQGYWELRAGKPSHGGCSLGTLCRSHVSGFSCSEHDCLLVWLFPGCSSLVSKSAEWRMWFSQCKTTWRKCAFSPKPQSGGLHNEHTVGWKVVGKWWLFKDDKQSELSNHSLPSWQKSCQNNENLIQLIKY